MPLAAASPGSPLKLSAVVPFHRNLGQLRLCLNALRAAGSQLPAGAELTDIIVAADGAIEDLRRVAAESSAEVLPIAGPLGPATARTRGAERASGDVLVFVDTDVVVHPDALARIASLFLTQPEISSVFGAYDEEPADQGFFSQCRNLAHSFIHQLSDREAQTFWAGLGAVRVEAFKKVGGFDPRFVQPSVEDIDLGYRMRQAGLRIVLEPAIRGTHLKRWTFWSSVVSDIRDRGVPWTQLLRRYRSMRNDLNLTYQRRLAVVMAYAVLGCGIGSVAVPVLLAPVAVLLLGLWVIDRSYYQFFVSRRGLAFTLAWFPFHVLHHLCNGVSFALGTALYFGRRWAGISLPWALPLTPWSPREIR